MAILLIGALIGIVLVHDSGAKGASGTTTSSPAGSRTTTAAGKQTCSSWPWGDQVKTEPAALASGHPASGIYIWSTFYSWQVRVVGVPGAAGSIASSGSIHFLSVTPP
ncbi:MAG TPA: hypothetical protein VGP46_12530, partial [Acidimicrobiales bacterium]|nr:hypothetical protein [Acidimicrobiales bacterium]